MLSRVYYGMHYFHGIEKRCYALFSWNILDSSTYIEKRERGVAVRYEKCDSRIFSGNAQRSMGDI